MPTPIPSKTSASSADGTSPRDLWRISRSYWLILIGSGIWIFLRSRGTGGPPLPPVSHGAIAAVFALAVGNLALRTRSVALRGGYGRAHPTRIGWLFTALDLAIVTAGLRLTGGASSALWPIFFVIVVAETVLEPNREAWLVRGSAAFALLLATVPIGLHPGPWLLDLCMRLLFLFAVASVARRLRELSDREKAEVANLRAELALAEERAHLAREVHDGVGNSLAAAVLRLEVAARESHLDGGEDRAALLRDEAQALRQAMSGVRDWTFWTRPWPTSEAGGPGKISDLLRAETERLARRTHLPIEIDGADILDEGASIRAPLRLTILRISQEALSNAAKHATGASRATLSVRREKRMIVLTIRDDGPGLPLDPTGGLGIAMMRERAEGAGGTLRVENAEESGVIVTARLPCV